MKARLVFTVYEDDKKVHYRLDYTAPLKEDADWKKLRDKLYKTFTQHIKPPQVIAEQEK